MQSRPQNHGDLSLHQDHFDRIPDSLVLLILNKLADVRSLGRCSAVSKRFTTLVPLVHDLYVKIDRVVTVDGEADDSMILSSPKPQNLFFTHLLKLMRLTIFKLFHRTHESLLPQLSNHSPAHILKSFTHVRNLIIELPAGDVGTEDGVFLKWRAEFGSTLQSCVILGGTGMDQKIASFDQEPPLEDHGSMPESFYTNGGLKLRVLWTISSLIAASTRHYLLQPIVRDHPTLETLILTDADEQGTLSMGVDQIKEFREKPVATSPSSNRTQVPASDMKLRYAPYIELPEGTRMQGATLVAIRPSGESNNGGASRKEMEAFMGKAFDGPFKAAAKALVEKRTYLLEMNGF